MEKYVQLLGVLYIVFSALGLLAAIIVFVAVVGGGLLSGDSEAISITMIVGTAVGGFVALLSVPGVIGGIGLLKRKYWAKVLVLILGILNLPGIPIGTALGVYTIWVLMNEETNPVFQPVEKNG